MTNADKKLGYDSGDKTTVARIKTFASQNGALIGLIILCIALSIVAPAFLSASNLMNVGIQAATSLPPWRWDTSVKSVPFPSEWTPKPWPRSEN